MISDIFEEILTKLEQNLKNWAENPAACHALAFIIYQLNIETIEKYLGRLLIIIFILILILFCLFFKLVFDTYFIVSNIHI